MDKMTNCKVCGKEIVKGVSKCIHCGKGQRNFFMKTKIVSVLLVVAMLGIIGGCSSKQDQPTKVAENTSTSSKPASEDTKKNEPKTFKVGDVVQLKDYKITVNKVYPVSGNEFAAPKDGNEFIAIDCTVENISKEEKTVSSLVMFKVVDKDGRACEYSLMGQTAANAGQLDGTIGVGRKLSGVYVVEVPKGKTGLELVFDSSLLTGGQVIVTLN